jgi:hypothetical protein
LLVAAAAEETCRGADDVVLEAGAFVEVVPTLVTMVTGTGTVVGTTTGDGVTTAV